MAAQENEVELTRYEKFEAGMRSFCKFLYNAESGEVMGRNGSSWAKIGVFYVIFYGCLAGFFAIIMTLFLGTLNEVGEGGPKLTQYIKNKPGLNVGVSVRTDYNQSDVDSYIDMAISIKSYLEQYNATGYGDDLCPSNTTSGYSGSVPCKYDMSLLGNCSGISDKYYGLESGMPCVFIRVNKVYDWVPSTYGSPYLKLQCNGDVTVQPEGFLISAFPYRGQKFYRTPPVAVQAMKRGQTIRCNLEGKDIDKADSFNAMKSFGNIEFKV